jgi:hypothetical protein
MQWYCGKSRQDSSTLMEGKPPYHVQYCSSRWGSPKGRTHWTEHSRKQQVHTSAYPKHCMISTLWRM